MVPGDLVALNQVILNDEVDEEHLESDESSVSPEVNIHVVTEEDIAASKYTIRDVLLPLIGRNTLLPLHQTGDYIRSLLEERGLPLDSINKMAKSGVQSSMRGHYRRVVEFATDFSYKLVDYSSPHETIQETEIQSLNLQPQLEENPEEISVPSTKSKRALVIEFNLSSGSYATMLLRELMKEATDASYHAELTASSFECERQEKQSEMELALANQGSESESRKRSREEDIS